MNINFFLNIEVEEKWSVNTSEKFEYLAVGDL